MTTHEDTKISDSMRAFVSGRVQGVGFRYFVLQHGRRLGLDGMTRNLPDGRVEVVARGDRATLERLIALLQQGPGMSRVDDVKVEWGAACPDVKGFGVDL